MKLLAVDDHAVVRAGLRSLLEQPGGDTTVLLAEDVGAALAIAAATPDLDAVILDLRMPGTEGPAAIAEFGRRWPALPVIVLSGSEAPDDVRAALAAGALGYVPKSAAAATLLAALSLVLAGELYVPPLVLDAPARDAAGGRAGPPLTERHREVLRLIAQGQSNKQIARSLGIAEKTVKAHVTAILRALDVTNRTQASAAAQKFRLV